MEPLLIIILICCILIIVFAFALSDDQIVFVEYETVGESYGKTGDYIIKVIHQPCRLARMLGKKGVITKYIGSGTVWHNLDTERRAGTPTESWLANKYTFIKYDEQGLLKGRRQ